MFSVFFMGIGGMFASFRTYGHSARATAISGFQYGAGRPMVDMGKIVRLYQAVSQTQEYRQYLFGTRHEPILPF